MVRLFDALAEVVPASQIGPWLDTPNPAFENSTALQEDTNLGLRLNATFRAFAQQHPHVQRIGPLSHCLGYVGARPGIRRN